MGLRRAESRLGQSAHRCPECRGVMGLGVHADCLFAPRQCRLCPAPAARRARRPDEQAGQRASKTALPQPSCHPGVGFRWADLVVGRLGSHQVLFLIVRLNRVLGMVGVGLGVLVAVDRRCLRLVSGLRDGRTPTWLPSSDGLQTPIRLHQGRLLRGQRPAPSGVRGRC